MCNIGWSVAWQTLRIRQNLQIWINSHLNRISTQKKSHTKKNKIIHHKILKLKWTNKTFCLPQWPKMNVSLLIASVQPCHLCFSKQGFKPGWPSPHLHFRSRDSDSSLYHSLNCYSRPHSFRWRRGCSGKSGQLEFSQIVQNGARGQEQQPASPPNHCSTCNPCWRKAWYIRGSRYVPTNEGGPIRCWTKDSSDIFLHVDTSKCTLLGALGSQSWWVVTSQLGPVYHLTLPLVPLLTPGQPESCLLGVFCPQVLFRNLTGPIKAQCWWRQPVLPSPSSPALPPVTQWGRL